MFALLVIWFAHLNAVQIDPGFKLILLKIVYSHNMLPFSVNVEFELQSDKHM